MSAASRSAFLESTHVFQKRSVCCSSKTTATTLKLVHRLTLATPRPHLFKVLNHPTFYNQSYNRAIVSLIHHHCFQFRTMSRTRRDQLLEIEAQVQKKWAQLRVFEANAPQDFDPDSPSAADVSHRDKFFCTFPYPYMNGVLHLGHGFSMSKSEFAAGFQRLKGRNTLFPFAFHCTGMPIAACATKLKKELDTYGCPPNYNRQVEETAEVASNDTPKEASAAAGDVDPTKHKSKKSKVAAKTGGVASQYKILKDMGIPDNEIPNFVDPIYWLRYFPPLTQEHLTRFGMHVDWRRSFITTEINPYYDSFVQWQFEKLRAKGKINFGKRFSIYSPLDGQPCADHDRATGEGVCPQEYTLIKIEVKQPFPPVFKELQGKRVFLGAATLRPETMYGQTNCWVLPDAKYGAYEINDTEVIVLTDRAALNLSYQFYSKETGKPNCLLEVNGTDLIGVPLSAPNTSLNTIYALPMMTISTEKGTGIVTSVPSDAPDDFMALMDLKKKPKFRELYHVKDEWVMPFDPIPIIDIPGYGNMAALKACEDLKVASQNDRVKLDEAKKAVYLKGFYEGVLCVGPYSGEKIINVKNKIKEEMIKAGQAIVYCEPEKPVMSRSGDECVVALTDQWYISYGEEEWRKQVADHLKQLETYTPNTMSNFEEVVVWLKEWACSRTFGLGTRLPWDRQFLIDSLSDSTVYMAFYTIAHLLQGGSLDGSKGSPLNIRPEQLTHKVWDMILLGAPYSSAETDIPQESIKLLRREFEYWYPVDLRVSGKELICNHLTMFLYNHAAIWDNKSKWPRSIFANGHIKINDEKMSKSTGNFLTIIQSIEEYSADAVRFALADAGDGLEDANFRADTANSAILRFTAFITFVKESLEDKSLRTGTPDQFSDNVMLSMMNRLIKKTDETYTKMQYRDALKYSWFEMQNALNNYRVLCGPKAMHKDVLSRFFEIQAILLSPIAPHFSEHLWELIGKQESIMFARFPEAGPIDEKILIENEYLQNTFHNIRTKLQKGCENYQKKHNKPASFNAAYIYIADSYLPWQKKTIEMIASAYAATNTFPAEPAKMLSQDPELKKNMKSVMSFAASLKEEVDSVGPQRALSTELTINETETLTRAIDLLKDQLSFTKIDVINTSSTGFPDPEKKAQAATPLNPQVTFYTC